LGDERDGPRGRIVMMQKMLEAGGTPSPETVTHLDRCLSCLSCRTACPSGVDYARLIDAARAHIETPHRRPLPQRVLRWFVAKVLARPGSAKLGVVLAKAFAPLATRLPGRMGALARIGAQAGAPAPRVTNVTAPRRVALMSGCVQIALQPSIDAA